MRHRISLEGLWGKWKPCIIDAVSKGHHRPTDIHKAIPEAPKRVVDLHLAELVKAGVLIQSKAKGFPLCSKYQLTLLGHSILPLITAIDRWGVAHKKEIRSRLNVSQMIKV